MLDFFVGVIVFIVSAIIGSFGFSQIIGNIKFVVTWKRTVLNFVLWGIILFLIWYAANSWLPTYMVAFYIGYAVTFFRALLAKPDIPKSVYVPGIKALFSVYRYFLEVLAPEYDKTTNQLEIAFDGVFLVEDLKNILLRTGFLKNKLIQINAVIRENMTVDGLERILLSLNTIISALELFDVILKKRIDLISEKLAAETGEEYTKQFDYDDVPIEHTVAALKARYPQLKMEYNFLKDTCIAMKIPME